LIRAISIALCVVVCSMPMTTRAQLRPLEPPQWRMLDEDASIAAEVGGSRLTGQRASLAGTTGKLWEAGTFAIAWRTGRVVLEAAGTAQRFFHETGTFSAPYPDVEPSDNGDRHDSGDYRISTTVRLTPRGFPATGVLRFGTRLPTTDNSTGLDRDALDFFATFGGAGSLRALSIAGEAGLGIHSTREQRFEQEDVMLYSLRVELRNSRFIPSLSLLGQKHGLTHDSIRGVEDLGEMRAGLRIGRHFWARAEYVRGYESFSPSSGFILTAGVIR
jgi:hypothetical protein